MRPYPTKAALTLALCAGLAGSFHFTPPEWGLHWWPDSAIELAPRALRPSRPGESNLAARVMPAAAALAAEAEPVAVDFDGIAEWSEGSALPASPSAPPRPEPELPDIDAPPLEHPEAIATFFDALAAAEAGTATARVLHLGDSLIMSDYVTRTMRQLLQARFGDAGPGFVLAGRPSPWYGHGELRIEASDGWRVHRLTRPTIADGTYGLGGATFRTSKRGQSVHIRSKKDEGEEAVIDRVRVFYLAQPRGGKFTARVGKIEEWADTAAEAVGLGVHEMQTPLGAVDVELRVVGGGEVRLFGVVLEREGPGIVYDALGLGGARTHVVARHRPEAWLAQARARTPNLLVLHYGTNDSWRKQVDPVVYRDRYVEDVLALRQGLADVACLVVGPMDRAERDDRGRLRSRPSIARIVSAQREAAAALGCAFWDTFAAMGGEGAMARWYRARPPLGGGDLTHPTRRGAERIGAALYVSLIRAFTAR